MQVVASAVVLWISCSSTTSPPSAWLTVRSQTVLASRSRQSKTMTSHSATPSRAHGLPARRCHCAPRTVGATSVASHQ